MKEKQAVKKTVHQTWRREDKNTEDAVNEKVAGRKKSPQGGEDKVLCGSKSTAGGAAHNGGKHSGE